MVWYVFAQFLLIMMGFNGGTSVLENMPYLGAPELLFVNNGYTVEDKSNEYTINDDVFTSSQDITYVSPLNML